MKRKNTAEVSSMDYGILWGFVLLVLAFELMPGSSVGRLASRTVSDEMQGFDPGELYEIPPEMPEDDPVDVENIIRNEIPDVVEPILVISTDIDDEYLAHASTVNSNYLTPDVEPDNTIRVLSSLTAFIRYAHSGRFPNTRALPVRQVLREE